MKITLVTFSFILWYHLSLAQSDMNDSLTIENHRNSALDMIAFGYQIGGRTYVGLEYEFRFSKYIGLNIGAGISGITGGLKFHTCPCRTGPFLNISFKDGGFGKIGTINAEIGGILFFMDKKEKFGIAGQIGAGKIVYITDEMKEKLTKNGTTPEMMLSFGIGLGWYFN